jgi:4-amino-4-deoxy-L-arabinose transferase-like glycosyltransferase
MNKTLGILLGILVLALGLRLVVLTDVPPGLNRDEAAIGYNAYSLLKTARDEYGIFLPVSLKSFGDWKLPGFVYIAIPFVWLFGLTEFAVRIPSVLAGVLTLIIAYQLTKKLFHRETIALLTALLLAVSPWHLFFSRVSSEANLAVLFVALGTVCLLSPQLWLLPTGSMLLGLSMLTYHGNHIFTPLLFLILALYIKQKLLTTIPGRIAGVVFILITGIIFSQTLFSADKTKISGLFSLNDPSLVHEHIVQNRLLYTNALLGKLFNNKLVFLAENISQNYLRSFSPEFLFIRGGGNEQHNIPDFGNLYLVEAPFLLLGLYYLFAHKQPYRWLLLGWLLISPIGAALTKDAPHSARQFAIFPAITIVIAYGIVCVLNSVKNFRIRWGLAAVVTLAFMLNISLFLARYFIAFPYKSWSVWGAGYRELIAKVTHYQNNYEQVTISRPDYSPYIYYLFYKRSDPRRVQTELKRYPETSEGFAHVREFDGITYQKINWTTELLLPNRLYIDWAEGVPSGATNSAILITKSELIQLQAKGVTDPRLKIGTLITSRVVDTVRQPNDAVLFYLIETRIASPEASRQ